MTPPYPIDVAALLRLERHQTESHAIPHREIRDLGDSLLLFDPRDADPFWNRLARIRWPSDAVAFDRRLTEVMALFLVLGRRPHAWPSPVHAEPADLAARLAANGFSDIGGGHVMMLVSPEACGPVLQGELPTGTSLHVLCRAADAGPTDIADLGAVLGDAFGTLPERALELADDLRRVGDDPRVGLVLARVNGVAAAAAKTTTFDGLTFLSSVGTRPAYRGRGLAGLVTRAAIDAAGARARGAAYLGVFSGNAPALALYDRLGFASIGESPDLLLG